MTKLITFILEHDSQGTYLHVWTRTTQDHLKMKLLSKTNPNFQALKMEIIYCSIMFHVAEAKIIRHTNMVLHVETLVHFSVPKKKCGEKNTLDFTFAYGSILSGSKGDSASWRESLRLSWAQARNTFRSSVALVLDNNLWWQFQDGHLELRIIDPVNQVKGFKASVIARITAHTWIQLLILERKKLG